MAELHLAGGTRVPLRRPLVMAIVNATPDSFSDGGLLPTGHALEDHIRDLLRQGADILDVGGESTRPGHEPVDAQEELRRVLPVLAAIRRVDAEAPISIDTSKAEVARAALAAGASFVNDVRALADPGMAPVVKAADCSLVLMRHAPCHGAIVQAARAQLDHHVRDALAAGVQEDRIVVDPGLGFGDPPGSDVVANMALVRGIRDYARGRPVLIGASRKRFIGTMTNEPDPARRVAGSVAVAIEAAKAGAAVLRVHDVGATVDGLRRAGQIP